MGTTRIRLLGLAATLACSSAFALGLGEIEVSSRLNQPLNARIFVTSTSPAELNSVSVKLAGNEDFERAGVDRSDFLSSLEFELRGDQLYVSSSQAVREPYVSFLIEVRWSGGRLLREYTLLLDPPGHASASSGESTVSQPVVSAPAPASDAPARASTKSPADAPLDAQTYGPVQGKETLWSIATKLRPDSSLTMDQVQWAIYQANPAAFDGGITGLRRGVMLKIPSMAQYRAISADEANAKVRGEQKPVRKPAAPKPAQAEPTPAAKLEAEKPAPPAVVPTPAPAPAPVPAPIPAPVPAASATVAAASANQASASAPTAAPVQATTAPSAPSAPAPATTPIAVASPDVPVNKAMVDEEPATASAPASTPTGTTEVPGDSAPSAPPVTPPAPQTSAPPPAPEEVPEQSLLDNPLFFPSTAALVLLGAGVFGASAWKRRRAKLKIEPAVSGQASGLRFDPAAVAATIAAQAAPATPAKTARERLEEDTLVTETALSSTTAMEPTLAQTVAKEPEIARTASGAPRKVDFDVTAQFAAETVQINLDANDPLAEADFHLAYGLYDEAALLLKQAAEKNPERLELRIKLAEVYFAAGKADDFRKTAEALKPGLPAAQWSKVAIMGQQLCPDSAAFKGAGAAEIAADIDLAFDEPAAAAAPPPPPVPAAPKIAKQAETLEFNLDDLQLPTPTPEPVAARPTDENTLQFDLGDLKLDTPASSPIDKPADIDLDGLSLDQFDTPASDASATLVTETSATLTGPSADSGATGDEVATKLDLARAYMDMGDADMAKSLLGEVTLQGSAQQKGEAQGLLAKLG